MKILDRYIIKTFFGPVLFIFSVLFFIFIVNIVWIQMMHFFGKGLSYFEIGKVLFYYSASVVSMVLPLTILLSSIMAFGEFGERYELAAMKAAGISLTRIMLPLFIINIILSFILFLFQNNITPNFQRKARNMSYNIAVRKPALNFTPGQFISQIPGYAVKFDKIEGENAELVEGIFIHKSTNIYENQETVIAKKGKFVPAADKNFLKLELYSGFVYQDDFKNKDYTERLKQPNQSVKFDTLVLHFDVSEIINKAIENEQITDDYHFQTYLQINETIDKQRKSNDETFKNISSTLISNANNYIGIIKAQPKTQKNEKIEPQFQFDTIKKDEKLDILYTAYNKIEIQKNNLNNKEGQINDIITSHSKMIIYQQRILSYSATCIIFFLIGASLGSIIRKGGMGIPVVVAIVIFVVFYVMNLTVENFSWKGKLNPYLAAWLPNMILFPFSIWMTYKALTDSQLFDTEKYKTLLKPITKYFIRHKEHSRYR